MVLCTKTKLDNQNRLLIPRDYLKEAGGTLNGQCYILFDEETKRIVVIPVKEQNKKTEETDERTR